MSDCDDLGNGVAAAYLLYDGILDREYEHPQAEKHYALCSVVLGFHRHFLEHGQRKVKMALRPILTSHI